MLPFSFGGPLLCFSLLDVIAAPFFLSNSNFRTKTLPVTGPVARFARQIASHGYIAAAPSSYHEFTGPEALAYDGPGTDKGNDWKVAKKLSAYDEDATLTVDHLLSLPTCTGRIGATGMCLGGHLAYRAALDKRVAATICYFATDIHSHSLGEGMNDDSLKRAGDIKGELILVCLLLICTT
jgi:carboxymethylenebutenolidase